MLSHRSCPRGVEISLYENLVYATRDLPERRHCDDGVPECCWNALEVRVGHVFLGVEHDSGEDDDSHRE